MKPTPKKTPKPHRPSLQDAYESVGLTVTRPKPRKPSEVERLIEGLVNWPEPKNVKRWRFLLRAYDRAHREYREAWTMQNNGYLHAETLHAITRAKKAVLGAD